MALDTLDTWAAPFDNAECSLVTPVPYGDLHSVSPYVATPQVIISSPPTPPSTFVFTCILPKIFLSFTKNF